mmetsp:Transcript_19510/g.26793  ORF Transcript_19510/g.26793 Transcript_19510/m.26793 type:complete len:250 (+) Transcript_19510:50-799(+)
MTNITTDTAFLQFLTANGVAGEYGGYDGATKLGWRNAFQQQQRDDRNMPNMERNTVAVVIQEFDDCNSTTTVTIPNGGTYESVIEAFIDKKKKMNEVIIKADYIFSVSSYLHPEVDNLAMFGTIVDPTGGSRPPILLYYGQRQFCIKCSSLVEIVIKLVISLFCVLVFYLLRASWTPYIENKLFFAISSGASMMLITGLWTRNLQSIFAYHFQKYCRRGFVRIQTVFAVVMFVAAVTIAINFIVNVRFW